MAPLIFENMDINMFFKALSYIQKPLIAVKKRVIYNRLKTAQHDLPLYLWPVSTFIFPFASRRVITVTSTSVQI